MHHVSEYAKFHIFLKMCTLGFFSTFAAIGRKEVFYYRKYAYACDDYFLGGLWQIVSVHYVDCFDIIATQSIEQFFAN